MFDLRAALGPERPVTGALRQQARRSALCSRRHAKHDSRSYAGEDSAEGERAAPQETRAGSRVGDSACESPTQDTKRSGAIAGRGWCRVAEVEARARDVHAVVLSRIESVGVGAGVRGAHGLARVGEIGVGRRVSRERAPIGPKAVVAVIRAVEHRRATGIVVAGVDRAAAIRRQTRRAPRAGIGRPLGVARNAGVPTRAPPAAAAGAAPRAAPRTTPLLLPNRPRCCSPNCSRCRCSRRAAGSTSCTPTSSRASPWGS